MLKAFIQPIVARCAMVGAFFISGIHAADADASGKSITINAVEFRAINLGVTGAATWSMATTETGFNVAYAQGDGQVGEGTKFMKLITISAGIKSPPMAIEEPNVPGAKPGSGDKWGGASGKTIRFVLPSGKVAGTAIQIEAGGPQSRAFAPTADGIGYDFLPKPDPRQCANGFNAVGGSEVKFADAEGSIYGSFVVGAGGKALGLMPVRWSVINGKWKCQALLSDVAYLEGLQIDICADTERGIFLNLVGAADPGKAAPFRSVKPVTVPNTGVEQYQLQGLSVRHQVDGIERVGRVLVVQGDNILGYCWKQGEAKVVHPVIWSGPERKPRVIDAIAAESVGGAAIIGDTMFISTVQAGAATTTAFTGETSSDVSASGLVIDTIACRSAGGFVAKGSLAGASGYWLVMAAKGTP